MRTGKASNKNTAGDRALIQVDPGATERRGDKLTLVDAVSPLQFIQFGQNRRTDAVHFAVNLSVACNRRRVVSQIVQLIPFKLIIP